MRYRVGEKAKDSQVLARVTVGGRAAPVSNGPSGSANVSISRDGGVSEIRRGIRVRETPRGRILGLLPQGAEVTGEKCSVEGWVRINGIAPDGVMPSVVGGTADVNAASGYVYSGELEEMIVPSPLDSVVVLDKPYPIKYGQLVGYVGEYQVFRDATPLPAKPGCAVLHLEVFAGDQLSSFLEKSRAYARSATGKDKTRLRVMASAVLVSVSSADKEIAAGTLLQATKDSPRDGAWAGVG